VSSHPNSIRLAPHTASHSRQNRSVEIDPPGHFTLKTRTTRPWLLHELHLPMNSLPGTCIGLPSVGPS